MRHRNLLALARWTLISLLGLLSSGPANATVYTICNKGKIEARYATALRQGGFLSGYSWDVNGWYPIAPGECVDAYQQSSKRTGEPIYVAIAFTDSTGVWGAATFQGEDVDTKLCLRNDIVGYHLQGDIDQPCRSGFYKFPAALYLEPQDRGCLDSIGVNCLAPYTYNFKFALDANSRAIAVNQGSGSAPASGNSATSSSGPSVGTALAVLGALVVGAAILADTPADTKKSPDTSTARPTPAPEPNQNVQHPSADTSSAPDDDPIGGGGFITPPVLGKKVNLQVCVPAKLVQKGWDNPPPGGKMEAFKAAILMQMDEDSIGILRFNNVDEYEMTLDFRHSFDSFVAGRSIGYGPGNIDPRDLVTGRDTVKGRKHVCPLNTYPYQFAFDAETTVRR